MSWSDEARLSASETRRRNYLGRTATQPEVAIPKRTRSGFVYGDPRFRPNWATAVFVERSALAEAETATEALFNVTARGNSVEKVRARNIAPLLRKLRKSYAFEDMVRHECGHDEGVTKDEKWRVVDAAFRNSNRDLCQAAAGIECGIPRKVLEQAWPPLVHIWDVDDIDGMQLLFRAVYNRTQDWFRHRRITHMTLFRGLGYSTMTSSALYQPWFGSDFMPKCGDAPFQTRINERVEHDLARCGESQQILEYHSQALSAWTGRLGVAHRRATGSDRAVILAAVFPVGRLISTAYTGWGDLHAREVFVIGGEMRVAARVWLP